MDTRQRTIYATTAVVAAAWVVLDQATKMVAVRTWSVQEPTDLGPVVLRLIYNEGGAFSLPIRLPWLFVAVTLIVCVLVIRALPTTRSLPLAAAYGLVVGGAIGNGADRIFRDGAVVDMIDLDFPPLQTFPVFNVADVGITAGAALVILLMILHDRRESASRGGAVLEEPSATATASEAASDARSDPDGEDDRHQPQPDRADAPLQTVASVEESPDGRAPSQG